MFGCFFGHLWSKYAEPEVRRRVDRPDIRMLTQRRQCERCGLIEDRAMRCRAIDE